MRIFHAPIQGSTGCLYRRLHASLFGGCDAYLAPFVHIDHGMLRTKDLRDISPDRNEDIHLIPQIIGADAREVRAGVEAVAKMGYGEVDINMGCPFPPQALKGRGSGLLSRPDDVSQILYLADDFPDISFSLKMRLGWEDSAEALRLLPVINEARLSFIALHPRIGRQQYKGVPDMESFRSFSKECRHPLVYNGDIASVEDAMRIMDEFPSVYGLMLGRGLLARPSLADELAEGRIWDTGRIMSQLAIMHSKVMEEALSMQGGEKQQLDALKQFWTYLEPLIGHKAYKMIGKSVSIRKYNEAVRGLF